MEKYETCKHVLSVGRTAVYVGTGCPRANMIRGTLVSTKTRCRKCLRWEGREDAENAGKGRKADPGTAESGVVVGAAAWLLNLPAHPKDPREDEEQEQYLKEWSRNHGKNEKRS